MIQSFHDSMIVGYSLKVSLHGVCRFYLLVQVFSQLSAIYCGFLPTGLFTKLCFTGFTVFSPLTLEQKLFSRNVED